MIAVERVVRLVERTGREDRHMPGSGELRSQQPERIIGRETELARLRGLVDPVPQASQVLLVVGEAGAGKSVLLADTAELARAAGCGCCRSPDGSRSLTSRSPGCTSSCGRCGPAPPTFPAGRRGRCSGHSA